MNKIMNYLAWGASFYFLTLSLNCRNVESANVAVSSNNVIVVAGPGQGGLKSKLLPDGSEQLFKLPAFDGRVNAFDDVTIDPNNPNMVFAFGAADAVVCGFTIDQTDASLSYTNCVRGFGVEPFSGVSASEGTLAISGGTTGFTILEYDEATAFITEEPKYLQLYWDELLWSSQDVLVINQDTAALSSQFLVAGFDEPRFGTLIVDLTVPSDGNQYKIANSLNGEYAIEPANYGLENTLYTRPNGQQLMFTANGAISVQDPLVEGDTTEIELEDLKAFTIAANQQKGALIVGGVKPSTEEFVIQIYSPEEPTNPTLVEDVSVTGRLTSVATNGDYVIYTTLDNNVTSYTSFTLQALPPTTAPAPAPTGSSPTPDNGGSSPTQPGNGESDNDGSGNGEDDKSPGNVSWELGSPIFFLLMAFVHIFLF